MTNSTKHTTACSTDTQVDLISQDELGKLSVNTASFARFDARMTTAIAGLQRRWTHKAAPAATYGSLWNDRQRRS
jgi:hypothetical protein